MKSQIVMYRDLFNPGELIEAKNKLPQRQVTTTTITLKPSVKRVRKHNHSKCRCKHPRLGGNGVCFNGRCRHLILDHKQYTEINYASYW